jgi:hypothetical protein
MPPAMYGALGDLRGAQYVIVTRGAWHGRDAIEILWEDHTDAPYVWTVTAEACLMLPGDPGKSQKWTMACWVERRGKPHRAIEKKCHFRRAPLPCLKPWGAE